MPPEESEVTPQHGRVPYPRHRVSIDGISSHPVRRQFASLPPRRQETNISPAPPREASIVPTPAQPFLQKSAPPQLDTSPQTQPTSAQLQSVRPIMDFQPRASTSQPVTANLNVRPTDSPELASASLAEFAKKPREKRHFKIRITRKTVRLICVLLLVSVLGVGGWFGWKWHANQVSPDTIFRTALINALSTSEVQISRNDDAQTTANLDLRGTSPTVSTTSTFSRYGSQFSTSGYGSKQSSYISYTDFPSSTPPAIVSSAKNAWVQIRADGALPIGIGNGLVNLVDPRYQAFGPVVFARLSGTNLNKTADYIISQKIYSYSLPMVSHEMLGSTKVYVFPVKINSNYLKLINESVTSSEGLTPSDIAPAIATLDAYKNAQAKLYISAKDHRILRFETTINNIQITFDYGYQVSVADEPQTKLTWNTFAPVQLQIDQASAARQTATDLDNERQIQLETIQKYLKQYYVTNNFYPTFANMNDAAWMTTNLNGFDQDNLRDPLGASKQLATQPKANVITYRVSNDVGKQCDNNAVNANAQFCTVFSLVATLTTGKQITVSSQ